MIGLRESMAGRVQPRLVAVNAIRSDQELAVIVANEM
jgi:hypothetical protein